MRVIVVENNDESIKKVKKNLRAAKLDFRVLTVQKNITGLPLENLAEYLQRTLNTLHGDGPTLLKVGTLILDTKKHEVIRDGVFVKLTPKEYKLLEVLMRHAGNVISRRQLLDYAWHTSFKETNHELNVHMKYLRRKIDENFKKQMIETIRGYGYVIRKK